MAARSVGSVAINFGLVNVPVRLFLAASSEQFSFNMFSPDGNRVKQKLVDAVTEKEVQRADTKRGLEISKDQYVIFTEEELASVVEKEVSLSLREFVDDSNFDKILFEKFYWLAPDKGSEKVYRLFAEAMQHEHKIAVGTWIQRGKDSLVVIRCVEGRLMMGQAFYSNEVRSFEYSFSSTSAPQAQELDLARMLIGKLSSDTLDLSKYTDQYASRVRALIESKRNGEAFSAPQSAPKANVMDLLAVLQASLAAPKSVTTPLPVLMATTPTADEVNQAIEGTTPPKKSRKKKADASGT